jgi:hypothetical protein
MPAQTFEFVIILWDDAWIDANEPMTLTDVESRHKPLVVKTFGWLIKKDEVGVTLAAERYLDSSEHDCFRTSTFIPAQMIKSITPVNLTKKRAQKISQVDPVAPLPSDKPAS